MKIARLGDVGEDIRHCDQVESAYTWDGTGCAFESGQLVRGDSES